MRILQVISSVDPREGGPNEMIKQLSKVLLAKGHETEIVCLDEPDAPWVADYPLPLHPLGPASGRYRYTRKFDRWLRQNASRFDAVIVRGLWRYTTLGTWRALRKSATPYFVFPHGMLDPWFREHYPLKHLQKFALWLLAEYRVLRDAKAVFFTCEEEKLLASRTFAPYRCNAVVVKYGTLVPEIDLERAREEFYADFPSLRDKRIILFLGRIHEKKGCDLLVNAFCRVASDDDDLHLVIAGPDESNMRDKLVRHARQFGMDSQIHWPGMLSGTDKWGAFAAAEAFALPSHQENFGIAVVEAMACGVPVLISDKVNIWREIERGEAGFVAPDDLEGTVELLAKWCATPEKESVLMSKYARQTFAANFELTAAAEDLLSKIQ